MPSGRPSIGAALHRRVEAVLQERPELGYGTTAEVVRDLLRHWLEEQERAAANRAATGVVQGATAPGAE